MRKAIIGKAISHTTLLVLIFIIVMYVVFPELDAKAGKLPVFLGTGAIYALLYWILAPRGYFRWYTDPDPATIRGTLPKGAVFAGVGLVAGFALAALAGMGLEMLYPDLLQSSAGQWINLPLNLLPLVSAYAGLVMSGFTGIYNRERKDEPSA